MTYPGPAEPLRRVWIALRAFGPTVLETVTLADIVSGELWLPGRPRSVPGTAGRASFLRAEPGFVPWALKATCRAGPSTTAPGNRSKPT